ncbi:MAG: DNA-3-methyladenine glycosylase 2 family protein [Chloroflexi bacterium]|nr:DNA-3-methyladenine glycosylase 2 family protein [Chloroflexota bacterium]
MAFFLPVSGPLDLKATLEGGQVFRWEQADGWYWGVIGAHGYALRQGEGGLLVRASVESEAEGREALAGFLRLDDDFDGICRLMGRDQRLREALARYPGLRLLRQEPWECLVSFMCSQVSNIPRISQNLRAIAQTYGEAVEVDGRRLYRFPGPERLTEAGAEGLRRLGLGFRAEYVALAAREAAEGRLDLMALREAPYQEAKERLMALKGVGEKVADCALAFSLEKLEAFPLDRWVRRALAEWYGQGEKVRYGEALAWAQARWGGRCGYVQQYLFHYRRMVGT